jgi:putative SOS response-associated peptidase YedK
MEVVHVKGLEIFHRVVPCHWLDLPTQFTRSCKSRNEVEIAELGVRSAALNRIFAVITTDANELVAEIHDRMPLILASGDYTRWLSDEPDPRSSLREDRSLPRQSTRRRS